MNFYEKNELMGKMPKKIINFFIKRSMLSIDDNVECLIGKAALWGISEPCVVCTDKKIILFKNIGGIEHDEYMIQDISSISISGNAFEVGLDIVSGGGTTKHFLGYGTREELQKIIKFVESKKDKENSIDDIDKIKEYHKLMQEGIVTSEEFEKMKKKLMNL